MRKFNRLLAPAAVLAVGLGIGLNAGSGVSRAQDTPPAAAASIPTSGAWTIDPAHSNVNFAIRHLGLNTVRGRFTDMAGTIMVRDGDATRSSVDVTIQAASINTDIKMRDDHLRSPDFFDVAKFPTITFRSTRVERGTDGGFVAYGPLTMHGVTKEIALPFKTAGPIAHKNAGVRFGAEATVRLNRQDFGISYGEVMPDGIQDLANIVDVTIGIEAVPAKPAAP